MEQQPPATPSSGATARSSGGASRGSSGRSNGRSSGRSTAATAAAQIPEEPEDAPRVASLLLRLHPPAVEAAYRRAQLRSACAADAAYVLCSLLCAAAAAMNGSGAGGGSDSAVADLLAAASTLVLACLLAFQLAAPAAYMRHRRAALAAMLAATLARDAAWLRAWTPTGAGAGVSAGMTAAAMTGDSAGGSGGGTCDAGGEAPLGNCSSGGTTAAPGAAAAAATAAAGSWGAVATLLLVDSGVSVLALRGLMLSLDLPWRAAFHLAEAALIMHRTAAPLARALAGPQALPLLARAHAALRDGALRALAALAALPLPAPLAARAGVAHLLQPHSHSQPPPDCLPLAAVLTAQVCLGAALPLWAAFLGERGRRGAFARAARLAADHDALAAAAAATAAADAQAAAGGPAPPPLPPPQQPCHCGDPHCRAALRPPALRVQGVPPAALAALLACAQGVCFLLFCCAVWFVAGVVLSPPSCVV